MGLDTYARDDNGKLSEDAKRAFADSSLNIYSPMLQADGREGWFRGKVYAHLLKATTGVDLYQAWIDSETVRDMNHNLKLAIRDLKELQKFMELCEQHNLGLAGDW